MLAGSGRLPSSTKRWAMLYEAVSTSIANVDTRSSSVSVTGLTPGSSKVVPSYGDGAGQRGAERRLVMTGVRGLDVAAARRGRAAAGGRHEGDRRQGQEPLAHRATSLRGVPGRTPGRHGRGRHGGPAGPGATPRGASSGRPVDAGSRRDGSWPRRADRRNMWSGRASLVRPPVTWGHEMRTNRLSIVVSAALIGSWQPQRRRRHWRPRGRRSRRTSTATAAPTSRSASLAKAPQVRRGRQRALRLRHRTDRRRRPARGRWTRPG